MGISCYLNNEKLFLKVGFCILLISGNGSQRLASLRYPFVDSWNQLTIAWDTEFLKRLP
jgi:hypothetical protein